MTDDGSEKDDFRKEFDYKVVKSNKSEEDILLDTQPLDYGDFFNDSANNSLTDQEKKSKSSYVRSIEVVGKYCAI